MLSEDNSFLFSKAFFAYSEKENRQNFLYTRNRQSKTPCLSFIHSPARGIDIRMAWEWTVYCVLGVWRYLFFDIQNLSYAFVYINA